MTNLNALFKEILDNIYDGVYYVDVNRKILFWNKSAERITGYSKLQTEGKHCFDNILMHVDSAGCELCKNDCPLTNAMKDGVPQENEVFLHHAAGHRIPIKVGVNPIRDKSGVIIGAVETFVENNAWISTRKKILDLQEAISVDKLTGLHNREYAELAIQSSLVEYQLYNMNLGCLFLDIDHFKLINDTYGHDIGDRVLKMIATTLSSNLRGDDLISRWGGEEFVVILMNINQADLITTSNKLRIMVENSYIQVKKKTICCTISIGACLSKKTDTVKSLIKRSDELMYHSKTAGRNRVTTEAA